MSKEDYKEIYNKINKIGINCLENSNLLENTIKEFLVSEFVENIEPNESQLDLFFKDFLRKNNLENEENFQKFLIENNLSRKVLQLKLKRSLKIQKFCISKFKKLAKEFFLENKSFYEKVTYSLIRVSDFQLAKELYLQIEAKEENIYDLAEKYSQGNEKFSKGVVGPIPLNQSHQKIIQKINGSNEGELFEPFKADNWWIILKLEKLFKVDYSEQLEESICRDFFEKKVLQKSKLIIKEMRINSEK